MGWTSVRKDKNITNPHSSVSISSLGNRKIQTQDDQNGLN